MSLLLLFHGTGQPSTCPTLTALTAGTLTATGLAAGTLTAAAENAGTLTAPAENAC